MKLVYSVLVVVALASSVGAETELAVLGPVNDKSLKPARAKAVRGAVAQAAVPSGGRNIDATCATDAVCLGIVGAEIKAQRVLAVTAKAGRKGVAIELVLVDVQGKELVARRDVTIADNKLAKDVPAEIKKFLDEAPVERAKALFSQGKQHYDLGEFAPALEFYKRAYRIKALPAFLFNIAQSHRKLAQYQDAVTMYQSYLAGVPNAPNKALVESLIAESQDKLGEERKQAAEVARRETERLELERKRAEAERETKEAEAVAAAARAKIEQTQVERERDRDKLYNRHPARKFAYIGAGLGVTSLIAGGVFGLTARNAQASFDDAACGNPDQLLTYAELVQCREDRDRGERSALLGNILMISGGALLATSAIVFLVDPGNLERPDANRAAAIRISPTSIGMVVRW